MRKIHLFKLDKLVRDKVPQIMRGLDIQLFDRVMEEDEYLERLKDKLLEEVKEVMESRSEEEICEELADLLEVILSLLKFYSIDFGKIVSLSDKKRVEKGGFNNKIYGESIEIQVDHPNIGYYKSNPDKYPELNPME